MYVCMLVKGSVSFCSNSAKLTHEVNTNSDRVLIYIRLEVEQFRLRTRRKTFFGFWIV